VHFTKFLLVRQVLLEKLKTKHLMLKTMEQWLRRCEPQAYVTLCDVVVHVAGFQVEILKHPSSILSKTFLNAEHEIP